MSRSGRGGGAAGNDTVTALTRYAKLEAVGTYRQSEAAAPVEVVLSFGARSLIIMGMDDRAIAHWPLASLRGRPADRGLTLAPDAHAVERVETEDVDMIAAIHAVCPDLMRAEPPAPPRRHRRNWARPLAVVAAIALVAGFLGLPAMAPQIARAMPVDQARALGLSLVATLRRAAPRPLQTCTSADGRGALATVVARVATEGIAPVVHILDRPGQTALLLPGGVIMIDRGLLDRLRSPEELAGLLAHLLGHAAHRDPLRHLLGQASSWQIVRLWLGFVPDDEARRTMLGLLSGAPLGAATERAADAWTHRRLGQRGLPSSVYGRLASRLADSPVGVQHGWGAATLAAADAADRIGAARFTPALDDRAWLALQNICDETKAL